MPCSQRSSQSGGYDGNPGASALGASYVNNGGGQGHDVNENDGNMYMMFSPAEHSDSLKLRKEKKRQERRQQQQQQSSGSPRDVKDVRLILPDAKKVGIRPYLNPDNGDTAWDTSGNNKNKNNLNARIVSPSPWTDEYRNGDSSAYDTREQTPRGASRSTTATRQETPTTPSAKNRPPRHESNVSDDQCFQFHDDDNNDAWYANWWSVCFPDAVAQTVVERPK